MQSSIAPSPARVPVTEDASSAALKPPPKQPLPNAGDEFEGLGTGPDAPEVAEKARLLAKNADGLSLNDALISPSKVIAREVER